MADGSKADNEKASREAGIYAYSRVAASLLLFLTLIVGARVYSKPEFAFVAGVLLLYETAMALGSLGLADAVFYFIGRDPGGARFVVRQTTLLLVTVAIPVIAAVLFAGYLMSDHELDMRPALPWLALVLVIELPTQPAVNQLIASGHAILASGLFVALAALRTVAMLLPGIVGLDVEYVPVIMGVTGLTRLAAHLLIVRKFFPLGEGEGKRQWIEKKRLREILWFALPAGAAMIAGKINPQIDKYAVKLLLGAEDFANYSAAAYELPLITLVPYAIGAVMQARYVRMYMDGQIDDLRALWYQTVRKTALLVVPLTMLIIALGREAIVLIAGYKFEDATLPFQIFTAVILHRVAAYSAILQATGQTRAVMVSSILMISSNLILTYPLTKLFGYPGPALATVLAIMPSWLYTLSRIGAVLGGGIRAALPWRFYAQVLALGAAVGITVWLIVGFVPLRPGLRFLLGSVLYIAVFVPIGRAVRMIGREDLGFLSSWLTLRMLRKPKG